MLHTKANNLRHVLTATGETRLLAHILVLGLHLEEFNIAPQPVAQELAVPVQRYVHHAYMGI